MGGRKQLIWVGGPLLGGSAGAELKPGGVNRTPETTGLVTIFRMRAAYFPSRFQRLQNSCNASAAFVKIKTVFCFNATLFRSSELSKHGVIIMGYGKHNPPKCKLIFRADVCVCETFYHQIRFKSRLIFLWFTSKNFIEGWFCCYFLADFKHILYFHLCFMKTSHCCLQRQSWLVLGTLGPQDLKACIHKICKTKSKYRS